ncbi:MAG: hypothetical protein ACYC0O_06035 [Desulfurivibrionaceae bacterium]|jgi:hypothetical protein|nr:hypothetical protein [Pseudomonadota bacterium]MCG2824272.1 hypothetical protein [Desulfobulbaceae bacterium]MDP2756184.1 hypothetical protein [Desulfurivibrionaceae bacterium]MBU4229995.1 hypothetical protein [Pseudomonadota bacterium]MBU4407869.1 hypothetical protein [Pseudomonadota bacterium]
MAETIPPDIKKDLEKAASLHQRASSDYEKCVEFNKLMSDVLGRLEDAHCYKTADRVMGILIDCNPKQGAQCEKAARIGDKMKKFERDKGSK